jgi:hypothetical protein
MESLLVNGKTIINVTAFTSNKIVRRLKKIVRILPQDFHGHKITCTQTSGVLASKLISMAVPIETFTGAVAQEQTTCKLNAGK